MATIADPNMRQRESTVVTVADRPKLSIAASNVRQSDRADGEARGLLKAVFGSIAALISEPSLDDAAPVALRTVGEALDVDRCVILENVAPRDAPTQLTIRYQWNRAGTAALPPEAVTQFQGDPAWLSWQAPLREGKPVITTLANANPIVKEILQGLGLASILLVPITVAGSYWGQIGLDDSKPGREWTKAEIDTLLALAALAGTAITRGRQNRALAEAHEIIRRSPTMYYRVAAQPGLPLTYISGNVDQLGYTPAQLLEKANFYQSLIHPDDQGRVQADQTRALQDEPATSSFELRMRRADGSYRWFELHRTPVIGPDGKLIAFDGELRDIEDRKQSEERLALSNSLLTAATENSPDGILVIDPKQNILAFNQHFVELWNVPVELMNSRIGAMLVQFIAGRVKEPAAFLARAAAIGNHLTEHAHDEIELADGRIFERHSGTLYDADRTTSLGAIFFFRDITARRRIEKGRERANRALRMMNVCDNIIIHATDEERLLTDICHAMVEIGGYKLAWIGYAQDDVERSVRPAAFAGDDRAYVDHERATWANNERGRGATGTAIRTGHIAIVRDTATDPNFGPWRDAAAKKGYGSSAALPLKADSRIYGALSVYASAPNMFDLEEAELLTDLAADIGFATDALRTKIERDRAQGELKRSEEKFRAMVESTSDFLWQVDEIGRYTYVSPRAKDMVGYEPAELIGKTPFEFMPRDEAAKIGAEFAAIARDRHPFSMLRNINIHKDGHRIVIETSGVPVIDAVGAFKGYRGIDRDVTAQAQADETRKAAEQQLAQLARTDALTALPNRRVFVEALNQAIGRVSRDGKGFAILYLDLDHFKDVNDTVGHLLGDELLKAVGERLLNNVRATDVVARFGGDEFAVLETDIQHPDEVAALATKLIETIAHPFKINGNQVQTGTSIGITMNEPGVIDSETLLSHADLALYRAKSEGRSTYRFFTESMDTDVHARVRLTNELREAIAAKQFFLEYQPQVQVTSGRIIGLEALVRWKHPQRGVLAPDEFIDVAEHSGLIVPIGHLVLAEACRQMKAWDEAGIAPPTIAVNVSANQLKSPLELEQAIASILAETGLPPRALEIELTETALMEKTGPQADALGRLLAMGVRLAIDDFGTGYSSLEYLRRLAVDRIKIAQTFVAHIDKEPNDAKIVRAAISLARALNIEIIAEGVETEEQLELIKSWRCDEVQGFYFAHPLSADATTTLLRSGMVVPDRAVRPLRQPAPAPAQT